MLDNLAKPVILTGAQIPLSELRNDSQDNFLEALITAADFSLPEVLLVFAHRIFRGEQPLPTPHAPCVEATSAARNCRRRTPRSWKLPLLRAPSCPGCRLPRAREPGATLAAL
jgi:hypothetical protein